MILQQWLAWFFNSHWHDSSTATGTILQQSLAWFFNSHWHDSFTVTGMIVQQALAWLFNSYWHDSSTVTGKIFFCADRILQQWCSLLKNGAMYQEYDIWFHFYPPWKHHKTFYFLMIQREYKLVNLLKLASYYNLAQNIWRLFHVLAQFLFTTSKTELD